MRRRERRAAAAAPPKVQQEPVKPTSQITVKTTETVRTRNEMIPQHIWEELQECGELAVKRLKELLDNDAKFSKFGGSTQKALIQLAMEYAYGKTETPVKRKITATLSGDQADAVADSLNRLSESAMLPEHNEVTIEGEANDES